MKNNAGKGEITKHPDFLRDMSNVKPKFLNLRLLAGHPDLVSKIPAPKAGAKPQEKPRATPATLPAATPTAAAAAAPTAPAAAREPRFVVHVGSLLCLGVNRTRGSCQQPQRNVVFTRPMCALTA